MVALPNHEEPDLVLGWSYILIVGSTSGSSETGQKVRNKASRIDVGYYRDGQRDQKPAEQNEKRVNSQSDLSTETVEGSARPFQGIDDIESGDGLALGMLGVGDRVTNDLVRRRRRLGRVRGAGGYE